MAKDAGGHGSEAHGGSGMNPDPQGKPIFDREAMKGFASRIGTGAAHQTGVAAVGTQPKVLPPESPDSRELRLFADNDADLHRQSMQPVRDNLGRKMDKGVYDPDKAAVLWKHHADRAAQSYGKQFGSGAADGKKMFSPDVRREAATHWEADERDDIKSGSSRTYKGK